MDARSLADPAYTPEAHPALVEIAARYRALVAGNLLGVVVADEGAVAEANDEFLRMAGYSREELEAGALHWREITPPEWLPDDDRALEELRETGTSRPYEKEFWRPDGTRVRFLLGASRLQENPLRWICFTLDRSREKQLEGRIQRLQEANAALSAAASAGEVAREILRVGVPAVGAVAGAVMRLVAGNDGLSVQLVDSKGYPNGMLAGWERIPISLPTPVTDACRLGHPIWIESPAERDARYPAIAHVNGHATFQAWAAVPLVVEGRILGAIGFSFSEPQAFDDEARRFVSAFADKCAQALGRADAYDAERIARRNAERAVERMSLLLRVTDALARAYSAPEVARVMVNEGMAALHADAAVVAELSDDGTGLAAIAMEGYSKELQRRARLFPVDAPVALALSARTAAPVFVGTRGEREQLFGEGASVPYGAAMAAPLRAHGRLVGSWALSYRGDREIPQGDRDFFLALTAECALALDRARTYDAERAAREEAERARQDAERANAAKSQFLATMSHELRTPLNAITGHTQLLAMGIHGEVSEAQVSTLERIDAASKHLLRLINDVLNMARIESGHVTYDVQPLSLKDVVGDLAALVLPQFRAKGIGFRTVLPEDAPGVDPVLVHADREKLVQVLTNLLGNAAKFTPEGGEVELALRTREEEPDVAYIAVRDTGPGIPPEKLESIFDPFVQVNRTLTSTHEGTGLGLAIARELALGMGGEVRVRSVLGKGATFTVTLRRAR